MATGKAVGYNSLHTALSIISLVPFASMRSQPFVERLRDGQRLLACAEWKVGRKERKKKKKERRRDDKLKWCDIIVIIRVVLASILFSIGFQVRVAFQRVSKFCT